MLEVKDNKVIFQNEDEKIIIFAMGKNSLRIKGSYKEDISTNDWALSEALINDLNVIKFENYFLIKNGHALVKITTLGEISFYKDDLNHLLLKEKYRDFDFDQLHSPALKTRARTYEKVKGGYKLKVQFEAYEDELIYGMGQYQEGTLNLKGMKLELAQRNSQVSLPFYLSNYQYGFLWNNPSIGEASFLKNMNEFQAYLTNSLDYLICVEDSPKKIIEEVSSLLGRAPKFPSSLLGLWQSKLRYRSPKEVMDVIKEYEKRNIKLSAIIIDYFHWTRQGEWEFDLTYWKDASKMVKFAHDLDIKIFISIWPTVDKLSKYYNYLKDNRYLIESLDNSFAYVYQGECQILDFTNEEAGEFVHQLVKKNYLDLGIDYLWLDQAEPEYTHYNFSNFNYKLGNDLEVGNIYPYYYLKAFSKHQEEGNKISLIRSAWLNSAKEGALLWSGDIASNFTSLRDQFVASLNVGLSFIPWWSVDIGGFAGNVLDEEWKELLIRWFEWAIFTPVLRMHGDRRPHDIPPFDHLTYGGGFTHTGRPNELYSFGEEVYDILLKNLRLREKMKLYLERLFDEASTYGYPLMRTMFFEYPNDLKAYEIVDQYMFGSNLLIAPIFAYKQRRRKVYLPKGKWEDIHTLKHYEGEKIIEVEAPLEYIPCFKKIEEE